MDFNENEIQELRHLCEKVEQHEEGGVRYLLLRQLHLPAGCSPDRCDALFCPSGAHGYAARLFFPQQIASGKTLNWNAQHRMLECNWHAFSWQLSTAPEKSPIGRG
ncbi:MAG TPA: hypothetical protein VGM51_02435 [Armatimonadota bacterium]